MAWLLLLLLLAAPLGAAPAPEVPEVVVVASALRPTDLARVPASITVLDADLISSASLQHFEELTPQLPNLNWSGEGSRARYFQVRGTGELEQYEGAPNASVGFIVDDIDLSGIGGVATTFDVGRIEVLRGPQGTLYGANALAGLIYVETGQPTATPGATATGTLGTDAEWSAGAVLNGPLAGAGEELTGRLAVQQFRSNGFRHNAYLGRNDTSGQDELTARAKLRWQAAPDTVLQLTAFHVDLDNGYDDFALANGFTTLSDKPGQDSQKTDAAALRATIGLGNIAELVSITGVASSDIVYGFDADWGNPDSWAPYVYDFTQRVARQRNTVNQELRLVSRPGSRVLGADWLVGAYALNLKEDIAQRDVADCPATTCGEDFIYDLGKSSHYEATNLAGYAELGWALAERTRVTAGLRREVRDARYRDSSDNRVDPVDRMIGGDLSLTHTLRRLGAGSPDTTVWARLARGYKAGGFNPGVAGIPEAADRLQFRPEVLWNYELGARTTATDRRWWASVSGFVQQRDDPQLKIPEQFRAGDPATFLFYTENAEEVSTRGIELEAGWQALEALELGASFGLLRTRIDHFSARPQLEGRGLAHAPGYTFAVNGTWRTGAGWFTRLDLTGKGGYAIDFCQAEDCQDPRTSAYQLLDLRAGRAWGAWTVEAWCRNLLDERYVVRGFYFGNEPPDFAPTFYKRLGDPRQTGVTVRYAW
ncbi:MAG: TonB-dependent receptor plug domain-containing protein [Gammaproteobacteria bacterium]